MTSCCVQGCENSINTFDPDNDTLSFHLFPRKNVLKQKWLRAIGRPDWDPPINAHVCSVHFSPQQLVHVNKNFWTIRYDGFPDVALPITTIPNIDASDVKVCRMCLATNIRMFSLKKGVLKACIDAIVGLHQNHDADGLPQFLCYICAGYLLKAYNLIEKSMIAQATLLEIYAENLQITKSLVTEQNRYKLNLVQSLERHNRTPTTIYEYVYDDNLKTSVLVKKITNSNSNSKAGCDKRDTKEVGTVKIPFEDSIESDKKLQVNNLDKVRKKLKDDIIDDAGLLHEIYDESLNIDENDEMDAFSDCDNINSNYIQTLIHVPEDDDNFSETGNENYTEEWKKNYSKAHSENCAQEIGESYAEKIYEYCAEELDGNCAKAYENCAEDVDEYCSEELDETCAEAYENCAEEVDEYCAEELDENCAEANDNDTENVNENCPEEVGENCAVEGYEHIVDMINKNFVEEEDKFTEEVIENYIEEVDENSVEEVGENFVDGLVEDYVEKLDENFVVEMDECYAEDVDEHDTGKYFRDKAITGDSYKNSIASEYIMLESCSSDGDSNMKMDDCDNPQHDQNYLSVHDNKLEVGTKEHMLERIVKKKVNTDARKVKLQRNKSKNETNNKIKADKTSGIQKKNIKKRSHIRKQEAETNEDVFTEPNLAFYDVVDLTFKEQKEEWIKNNYKSHWNHLETIQCDECSKLFLRRQAYINHLPMHDPERGDAVCAVCKSRYANEDVLNQHVRTAHSRRYHCRLCPAVLRNDWTARMHRCKHQTRAFRCRVCALGCGSAAQLAAHARRAHAPRHACAPCARAFPTAIGLRLHQKAIHPSRVKSVHSNASQHKCTICNNTYKNRSTLNVHLRTIHQVILRHRKRGRPRKKPEVHEYDTDSATIDNDMTIEYLELNEGDSVKGECTDVDGIRDKERKNRVALEDARSWMSKDDSQESRVFAVDATENVGDESEQTDARKVGDSRRFIDDDDVYEELEVLDIDEFEENIYHSK